MKLILSILPDHVVIAYPASKGFDVCNWDIVRPGQVAFELPYRRLRALGSGTFEFGDTQQERKTTAPRRIGVSEFSKVGGSRVGKGKRTTNRHS